MKNRLHTLARGCAFAFAAASFFFSPGAWAYNVSLAEGTGDAANWTISPTEANAGAPVTVTYTGEKMVKSVTARKVTVETVSLATPLTMEALSDGNIAVNIDGTLSTGMKYSVNGGEKTLIYNTTTINVTTGDKVQFYGNGTSTWVYGDSPMVKLLGTAQTKVYGNIMSLIDETGYETVTTLPAKNYVFYRLFDGNATLTDASGLLLPATTLAYGCYWLMFRDCTGLTAAPVLPATTLANYCYADMFRGCTSLTTAPALPATTLADGCYQSMFYGCTALTTAPALPATTLTGYCYFSMFSGCTSLSSVTCLATSGIDASNSTDNWLNGVAATGTFAADGTATWPAGVNGVPSGWTREEAVSLATPLTMEALTDGTIEVNMNGTLSTGMQYSKNGGDKTLIYDTTTIDVTKGDKVQFYGNGTSTQVYGGSPEVKLLGTVQTKVYGNIMSLIDETAYATATALPDMQYVFYGLFEGNATLTDASGLLLPATTLAYGCYWCMFRNCTGLTAVPALPAMTLANHCYASMFNGCTALTTAPALPATTLADYCYSRMFYYCTALTTAPALPATTLADYCYSDMFYNCTSLTTAPALPATTLAEGCYRTMFYDCTSLTTAPALPATTLADACYEYMFYGCTNLNSVTCLATSGIDTNHITYNWLNGVAATGTFFADSTATWPAGANGIPSGWTRQDASKVEITPTANANEWTFVTPPFDVELAVVYYADQDFADVAIAAIAAIGDVAYTDESKGKIDVARAAYNALTDAQKALVTNYATLTAAEAAYEALKPAPEPPAEEPVVEEPVAEEVFVLHVPTAEPAPTDAASEYNGYLRDSSGNVAGSVQLKLAKAGKDGTSKVTGAVQLGAKKTKVTGTCKGGVLTVGGFTAVTLDKNGLTATYGAYAVDGTRHVFAAKDANSKASAAAALKVYKTAYTVTWQQGGLWGGVTVTIGNKGKAKIAGFLPDGTKVSASGQLMLGEGLACVTVVSTNKKAPLSFNLWLTNAAATAEGLGADALAAKVGVLGSGKTFTCSLLGTKVPVTVAGKKWSVTTDKETALKLTFTPKTGAFKGSFKVGKQKATVNGVVVNGLGYGAAVIKKGDKAAVTIE